MKVRVGMEASGHARWFQRLLSELGNVALFVNSLSVLIGLALFKLHGFFTNDALGTPLAFGNLFG
jgi:hypothetical protein